MMRAMQLEELREPLSASLHGTDCSFVTVSTDTRSLQPGDLFVALSGPNFNGNTFVAGAVEKQACAAIVSEVAEQPVPQLEVADTRKALGQLGAYNRSLYDGAMFAVTGSSGKTTVKEMLASILAVQMDGAVLATDGNFNNEIGVPLTLLRLSPEHKAAVLELGASGQGEIAYTVALVKPQVALITNAAAAHLEGFGSLQGVVEAKGEIYSGLPADGVAVLNVDDPAQQRWRELIGDRRTLTFSLNSDSADVWARELTPVEPVGSRFCLVTPLGEIDVAMQVAGRHNVANALAASAAAIASGLGLSEVAEGLSRFSGVRGRLEFHAGPDGSMLIDDTYNANPSSFRAAIDVLASRPGRRFVVMGDMAELGDTAEQEHAALGSYAREQGIEHLLTLGPLSAAAAEAFGAGARTCESVEELTEYLRKELSSDVTALFKGSRSARMEQVMNAVRGEAF